MGEKEPDPGQAARESQTGMASGREAGSGGGGGGLAEASNLNLSKAGIDREMGSAMGAGRTHEDDWGAHTPAASETWTVDSTPPDVSAVGGAGAGAPGIAIGDPGVNGNISDDGSPDPAEAAINNAHSNIKNLDRAIAGGTQDPTPAEGAVVKSKSNIANNRSDTE